MSASVRIPSSSRLADPAFAALLEEVATKCLAGEPVDWSVYERDHPQHAEELRQLMPAMQAVADLSRSAQEGDAAPVRAGDAVDGTLGDYRILRELGRGGMGIVYEAEQISLERPVALKVLPFAGSLDARRLQRFQNEARAAASLHHPNIVPVYGVGCERAVHFYAMQYIDGQSLAAIIHELRQRAGLAGEDEDEPIAPARQAAPSSQSDGDQARTSRYVPPAPAPAKPTAETTPRAGLSTEQSIQSRAYFRTVAGLGIQAAEALEHAHETGVVHRDIKPANLLVDPRGKLWVTDFGLAQCQHHAGLTMTGDLLGTLRYMSPEQALAQRAGIDHRTDLYSLGATLYELLTLRPVFVGRNRQELLRQIAFEEPRPPRQYNSALPVELETIVLKALEKNPADRYGTAQELAADLRRFLDDRPIQARRPTLVQRARKWGRRHQAVVAAAGAVIVLVLAGLAVGSVLIWNEKERTRKALEAETEARMAAQESEARTEAVLQFVESKIFAAARPGREEGGLGHEVTLRQAIEAALPFVEKSFADQPLIEARLRTTVGSSFNALGKFDIAAELFQRAAALATKHLGPDHLNTLSSRANLAGSYTALGRHAEALKLFEDTLPVLKAKFPDHLNTVNCMYGLAICYGALGRHAEALKLNEETLALYKAKLGPDHPDTLGTMVNLAVSYAHFGRHADALKLLQEALPLMKAKMPDHEWTFNCMDRLANCDADLGRHAEALKLHEETLALRKAKLGPDHPNTLGNMMNLAISYRGLGRYADALKLNEETLAIAKAKLGPGHPDLLGIMNNLATSYDDLGRHTDALNLYEETLALMKAKLGPDHPFTLNCMANLATSYGPVGRHADALKLREETLVLQKAKFGPDHPSTLGSMNDLAASYQALGRHADALKLNGETLALRKAKLGPDHPSTLGSMVNLAESYADFGRHADALKLLKQALPLMKAKMPDHKWTFSCMYGLANCYAALGRYSDGLKLHEEVLALRKAKLGPNHPDTVESMHGLARILGTAADAKYLDLPRALELAQKAADLSPKNADYRGTLGTARYRTGDWKRASAELEKAIALRGPAHPDNATEGYFLAMVHWQLGAKAKARDWFTKSVQWMDQGTKGNAELKRFRAEAAALLGIQDDPKVQVKDKPALKP
jgi:serine/threonine protein kinase